MLLPADGSSSRNKDRGVQRLLPGLGTPIPLRLPAAGSGDLLLSPCHVAATQLPPPCRGARVPPFKQKHSAVPLTFPQHFEGSARLSLFPLRFAKSGRVPWPGLT